MTVSSTSNKIIYSGNGATTVWPFTFPGVASSDIVVYYTDADGVITTLSSTLYTVSLTAASGANPTGAGGSVTYPLTGSPIAIGTFLTIMRTLPLTQATSLANQSTLYQTVIESAMDVLLMQIQQLNELLGRQITVAVSDDTPTALPTSAERAGLYMAFDSDGNPTAVAGSTSTNPVSSAMTPVVAAATLALGRTAFGLGALAVEGIGAGLTDDGAGLLRAQFTPAADSTNQAVTSAFHWTERHATGALTYTLPLTSTLFNGFGFFVYALTGATTFAVNAADTFAGGTVGASLIIPAGSWAFISTNATGTWFIRQTTTVGLNSPLNLQINAAVAGNALTIAVKDRNGNDPSTSSPILLAFRDPTLTNGDPVIRAITSALSIVVPSSATLGTVSGVATSTWLVCFDNAGTPVLGVITCSGSVANGTTVFYPLDESSTPSGVAISAGSTSAGVFYTASTITTKPFRILGYIESTQVAAGTWATSPVKIQIFGPGIPKPGDVVQVTSNTTGTGASGTTAIPHDNTIPQITEGDQYMTQAITPQSDANILEVEMIGVFGNSGSNFSAMALFQDATAGALGVTAWLNTNTGAVTVPLRYRKVAGQHTSTTFRMRAGASGGTTYFNGDGSLSGQLYGGFCASTITVTDRNG